MAVAPARVFLTFVLAGLVHGADVAAQSSSRAGFGPKDGHGSGVNSWIGYTGGGNAASGSGSAVAAGTSNGASGASSFVGAGTFNAATAQGAFVGGGTSNAATGISSLVIGGFDNQATVIDALVVAGAGNRATGARSVVVGGGYNVAAGQWSFIGGGGRQTGSGPAGSDPEDNLVLGDFAVIVGGSGHEVHSGADHSVIAGGHFNSASGARSAIGGGSGNMAFGGNSTIPGGANNLAGGTAGFAAGTMAYAAADGEFVWADSTPQFFNPADSVHNGNGLYWADATNTFNARAIGGVMFVTSIDANKNPATGVSVSPGSGTWVSHSDRNVKENFATVDADSILDKVAHLPLTSWNYIGEGPKVRHLGPVAQDFRAAFGLGNSEKTIAVVDADGVALAAIQALSRKLDGLYRRLEARERRIEHLERELGAMKERLALD